MGRSRGKGNHRNTRSPGTKSHGDAEPPSKVYELLAIIVAGLFSSLDRGYLGFIVSFIVVGGIIWTFLNFRRVSAAIRTRDRGAHAWRQVLGVLRNPTVLRFAAVALTTAGAAGCYVHFGVGRPKGPPDPVYSTLVERPFGNTIAVVAKEQVGGREEILTPKLESELTIRARRQLPDSTWIIERIDSLSNKGYVLLTGLTPGEYQVQLLFYGIKLDVAEHVMVDQRRGQYVELLTPPFKGCVEFQLVDRAGTPLANAFLEVFPGERFAAIRGAPTSSKGVTECVWLHTTRYPEDHYLLKVTSPGQSGAVLASGLPFRVTFEREWEHRKERIVVP